MIQINASEIQPDDEWMQENEWDEIYAKENLPDINVGNIKESECMEDFDDEEIPKKKTFWIHDMDITFDKELTQEEMEKRFFGALGNAGVIGHRGCPN